MRGKWLWAQGWGMVLLLGMAAFGVRAQGPPDGATKRSEAKADAEEPEIVREHEIQSGGKTLKYRTTTGFMPLKSRTGEVEGRIFFMAYTKLGTENGAKRPLMFSFNGGPGSASVWLHLGALGPKRVKMQDDGSLPPPPYQLVDNPQTWLDKTDLVFIDPIGTGYSRPAKPELGQKFWSVRGDIDSVGEFIRLYLSRNQRWNSPLYLVGESYGTTRAAGLSGALVEKGIALNGIVLISSILNFQTTDNGKGNDLPAMLYLPTYTASAWYHKRLPPDLQKDLRKTLGEVEKFTLNEYAVALAKGDSLSASERQSLVNRLARYTGLSPRYIDNANLRIEIMRFCKELLRDEKRTVGRLDSRFKGIDEEHNAETPDFDPSMTAIRPPYTAAFNQYVREELGYKTDADYYILGGGITGGWDFGRGNGYTDTSEALRSAFAKNPYMKLFIASGFYDLATPYFATQYTLNHMGLDPSLRKNIVMADYEAGHMMYIHVPSLLKLKRDVDSFLDNSSGGGR